MKKVHVRPRPLQLAVGGDEASGVQVGEREGGVPVGEEGDPVLLGEAEPLGAEQSEMSTWIAEASEVGAQVGLVRKSPEGVLGGAGACALARARGAAGGSGGASPGRV